MRRSARLPGRRRRMICPTWQQCCRAGADNDPIRLHPEVLVLRAKTRRQFNAEYRLRQTGWKGSRAHRQRARWACPCFAARRVVNRPASGRLGARLGRTGSLRELAPWTIPRRRQPAAGGSSLDAKVRRAATRERDRAIGARVAHRAHDPGRAGKSCVRSRWRLNSSNNGTRSSSRSPPSLSRNTSSWRGARPSIYACHVMRPTYGRQGDRELPVHAAGPASTNARGAAVRPSGAAASCDVLAGSAVTVDRAPAQVRADAASTICTLPVLGADDVSDPRRRSCRIRERRNQREHPQYTKPELRRATAPNQTWSWEGHQAVGADQVDGTSTLEAVLDIFSRYATPDLDGRRPGELRRWPVGSSKRPATNRASSPRCSPCTPTAARLTDDEQVHRTTARRPRRDAFTEPALRCPTTTPSPRPSSRL